MNAQMSPRAEQIVRYYIRIGRSSPGPRGLLTRTADRFKVSRQRVEQIVALAKERGVKVPDFEDYFAARVGLLHAQGETIAAIARALHVSEETVSRVLKAEGKKRNVAPAAPAPPHGTLRRYRWKREPCRCRECRGANALYCRQRKAIK